MTFCFGPWLPLVALAWPLLLAGLVALPWGRPYGLRWLPLAPLPALWLGWFAPAEPTVLPGVFLGVTLGLDDGRALLLAMTAALWTLAGLAAQRMAGERRIGVFAGFWGLTLTGNLGVLLAQDVVTFYIAFAAVSLAAWALVIHERSPAALRAGRVYIVLAVVGEAALLVGLLLGAHAAQSLQTADVRAALASAPAATQIVALLLVGLGIKAGLLPLHVWLPLAHPAAPVAASAVLSGAIVKAGLVGMMVLLPDGAAAQVLMGLGLLGAFFAALWGLTQSNPKAVLAYSTVSQMGLMLLLVGAGGMALAQVPYYALHHGMAKGALFLLVGVMYLSISPAQRWAVLAVAAVCAVTLAGAPLTGGALVKAAAKQPLPEFWAWALTLTSCTTTLVMGWFLWRLWQVKLALAPARLWLGSWAVPVLAAGIAQLAPWLLWTDWTGRALSDAWSVALLLGSAWPVLLALPVLAGLIRHPLPQRPPGDVLDLWRGGVNWSPPEWPARPARPLRPIWPPRPSWQRLRRRIRVRGARSVAGAEAGLIRWRSGGVVLLIAVLGLGLLLG
jgi:formate hydrogenlyase subunit 3/multisubunit Na+/H+ antiporter MnhD subunit